MGKKKVPINIIQLGRDIAFLSILKRYNLDTLILLYQIGTYSPIEHIVNILIMKYGLPPFIGTLVIALL